MKEKLNIPIFPSDDFFLRQKHHNYFDQTLYPQESLPEIIKIAAVNDAIYIGDKRFIHDELFMSQFQITHLINTTPEICECEVEGRPLKVLNIAWEETPNQILLDEQDSIPTSIQKFIDESIKKGKNVLIYSVKGQNRACIILILYLLKKYNWTLRKSLEYLKHKKPDMLIPEYFLSQLENYESKLIKKNPKRSDKWFNISFKDDFEELLTNTFINDFFVKSMPLKIRENFSHKNIHVCWGDKVPSDKKNCLVIKNFEDDLYLKKNIKDISPHKNSFPLKSCIKKYKEVENNKIKNNESVNNLNNNIDKDKINIVDKTLSLNNINLKKINNESHKVPNSSRVSHKKLTKNSIVNNNFRTLQKKILNEDTKNTKNSDPIKKITNQILNNIKQEEKNKIEVHKRFNHSNSTDIFKNNLTSINDSPRKLNRNYSNFTTVTRIHGLNKILSIKKNLFSGIDQTKTNYNTNSSKNLNNGKLIKRDNNKLLYSNSYFIKNSDSNIEKDNKNNDSNVEKNNKNNDSSNPLFNLSHNRIINELFHSQNLNSNHQTNIVLNQNYYITQNHNIFTSINDNVSQNSILQNTNNQIIEQTLYNVPKMPQPSEIYNVSKILPESNKILIPLISTPIEIPIIKNKLEIYKILQNAHNNKKPQIQYEPQKSEIENRIQKIKKKNSLDTNPQTIPKKNSPKVIQAIQTNQNLSKKINLLNFSQQIPSSRKSQIRQLLISDNNYSNSFNDFQNNNYSNNITQTSIISNNFKPINNTEFKSINTRQIFNTMNHNYFKNFDLSDVYKYELTEQNLFKQNENSIINNLTSRNNKVNDIHNLTDYSIGYIDNSNVNYNNTNVYESNKILNDGIKNKFRFGYNKAILDNSSTRRSSVPPPSIMSFSGINLNMAPKELNYI